MAELILKDELSSTTGKKSFLKKLKLNLEYYLWTKPNDFYLNIRSYLMNLHYFRHELWEFRTWDYSYGVMMFKRSMELLRDSIEYGHEEYISRNKKVAAISELLTLLEEKEREDFVNNEEYDKALNKQFNRISRILRGQGLAEFQKKYDKEVQEIMESGNKEAIKHGEESGWYDVWTNVFDGTGIEGWWD